MLASKYTYMSQYILLPLLYEPLVPLCFLLCVNSCLVYLNMYTHFHRETMGLEGGVYLYHKMTPPPNLGHS